MNGNRARVESIWSEHQNSRFPTKCGARVIEGISLTLVDADVAGCVSTWLRNESLDPKRLAFLGMAYRDLAIVLPHLKDDASEYFGRVELMARLVLSAIRNAPAE